MCSGEKLSSTVLVYMTFYNSTEDSQRGFEILIFLDLIFKTLCALRSQ